MTGPGRRRSSVALAVAAAVVALVPVVALFWPAAGVRSRAATSSRGAGTAAAPAPESHGVDLGPAPASPAAEGASSPTLAASDDARARPRRGRVLLPDGRPARGAVLYRVPKSGGSAVPVAAPAAADGAVDLPADVAGSWLRAVHSHDGTVPAVVDGDALPPGEVPFRLARAPRLRVVLEGMEDFPLEQAQVRWRAQDGNVSSGMSWTIPREASSVSFGVGHGGPVEVTAWHPRYAAVPPSILLERPEGTVTFRMERGSRIGVRAVDASDGTAATLSVGWIEVAREGVVLARAEGGTDSEGVAWFDRAVPPGDYDVTVALAGRRIATTRVSVRTPDRKSVVDLEVAADPEAGVAAVWCGVENDGRPGTPPFFAVAREAREDATWQAVECTALEPNVLRVGPMPAGLHELLVWSAEGVGHVETLVVASDRMERTALGLVPGTLVDLAGPGLAGTGAAEASRHPGARIVRVSRQAGDLPLVARRDGAVVLLGDEAPPSPPLGPYPFRVAVEWRGADGELDSAWVDR